MCRIKPFLHLASNSTPFVLFKYGRQCSPVVAFTHDFKRIKNAADENVDIDAECE